MNDLRRESIKILQTYQIRRLSDYELQNWVDPTTGAACNILNPQERITWWLNNSNYTSVEKNAYLDGMEAILPWLQRPNKFLVQLRKMATLGSFIKDEKYTKFKYPRNINPRLFWANLIFGPWVKLCEIVVLKHIPVAVKGLTPDQMLNAVRTRIGTCDFGEMIYTHDYRNYEHHFDPVTISSTDEPMYLHVLGAVRQSCTFIKMFLRIKKGTQKLRYRSGVTGFCKGRKMSGETDTSLSNTFANFAVINYIISKSPGCQFIGALVEGDDALIKVRGRMNYDRALDIGIDCVSEMHDSPCTASFCGVVTHPGTWARLTCPYKRLIGLSWTRRDHVSFRKSKIAQLARARALSLWYLFPSCPVVTSMCRYVLRMHQDVDLTSLLDSRHLDMFERELLERALKNVKHLYDAPQITHGSRSTVAKTFGMPISTQLALEQYYDSCTVLQPVPIDLAKLITKSDLKVVADAKQYYKDHSAVVKAGTFWTSMDIPRTFE
jgi:hypothetical protein